MSVEKKDRRGSEDGGKKGTRAAWRKGIYFLQRQCLVVFKREKPLDLWNLCAAIVIPNFKHPL